MASAMSRLTMTPTHMFRLNWKQIIADASAVVVTVTPADRSNSPPIISSATPTATMPMVDEAYRTVASAGRVRNAGATAQKKAKITIAAASAPISGRERTRETRDRWVRPGGAAGAVDGFAATDELMACSRGVGDGSGGAGIGRLPRTGYRVLFLAYSTIGPMLLWSTTDGPVRTGPPPPMSLPLVRFSHRAVTAM